MQAISLDVLTATAYGFGLMALLTLLFGMIERSIQHVYLRSSVQGVFFGCGAVLAMLEPVQLAEGVIFDARTIIVGLAGGFGGGPAALVSAVIAGGYRFHVGGMGAPAGVAGVAIAALMGLIWGWYCRCNGPLGFVCLLKLGGAVALSAFSIVLLPSELIIPVLITIVPYLAVASVVGAVLMGTLLDRERRNLRAEKSWRHRANTDPLTGLQNRRAFEHALTNVASSPDKRDTFAVLLIDADHFKQVNDRHGHAAGDEALKFLATVLRRTTPQHAKTYRIGGEEFAMILNGASWTDVRARAETLRQSVSAKPVTCDGVKIWLTVSIGGALHSAGDSDIQDTWRAADRALYAAKTGGRNRVVIDANRPNSLQAIGMSSFMRKNG